MTISHFTIRPFTSHTAMNERETALWDASDTPNFDWSQFDFTGVRTGFLMGQIAFERHTRRNLRKRAMPSTDAILRVAERSLISVKVEAACRIELKTREQLQRLPKEVRRQNHLARVAAKTYKHRDVELARCAGSFSS